MLHRDQSLQILNIREQNTAGKNWKSFWEYEGLAEAAGASGEKFGFGSW